MKAYVNFTFNKCAGNTAQEPKLNKVKSDLEELLSIKIDLCMIVPKNAVRKRGIKVSINSVENGITSFGLPPEYSRKASYGANYSCLEIRGEHHKEPMPAVKHSIKVKFDERKSRALRGMLEEYFTDLGYELSDTAHIYRLH